MEISTSYQNPKLAYFKSFLDLQLEILERHSKHFSQVSLVIFINIFDSEKSPNQPNFVNSLFKKTQFSFFINFRLIIRVINNRNKFT